MAWQLIYTSAPRSLEAGRSGFGTVARHRAISPLLVSAIERASQFSRLPGTDSGRVIFSHRIVAVAGGRFHVLSAIRDAGADYTGRTNHIAHHLIVDPREIAQLGPDGPSPADLLLAMQWVVSWNEPPRFLEASDEVALSAIHPHTNGSAWEQITGSANQAWLLATGDASRGAYIIQPGNADLREVFAESLRLMPDRLWQISFTTSLQPSDEPGDFRWIGIEERSPLRAQSESSGRPVLNLALPDTLPLVETVQRPAASQMRQSSAPVSTSVWNDLPTASAETPSAVSGSNSSPTHQRTAVMPSVSPTSVSRIPLKWWLLAGAVVIVIVVGAVALHSHSKLTDARTVVADSLDGSYFTQHSREHIAKALVTSDDASRGKRLVTASNGLIQTLRDGNLEKLKSEQTNAALKVLDSTENQPLPSELIDLRRTVKNMQDLSVKPLGVDETNDAGDLAKIMTARRDEISKWDSHNSQAVPKPLIKELRANVDRQQADGLLRMATQRSGPFEGTPFRKVITDFGKLDIDKQAAATIKQIEKLLDKKVVESQPPSNPAPANTQSLPTPEKKAQKPPTQVPLYFVREFDALSKVPMPELEGDAAFSLVEPLDKPERLLFEDTRKDASSPASVKLHINASTTEIAFAAKANGISCEKGSKSIPLPFSLVARRKIDKFEMVRVFFIGETASPIFKARKIQIKPSNSELNFDWNQLELPGIPNKNELKLELSQDWAYPSNKIPKVQFVDGAFSLAALKTGLDGVKKKVAADIANSEASLKEIQGFSRDSEFGKLKSEFIKISHLATKIQEEKDRLKKAANGNGKPAELQEEKYLRSDISAERQYGGCIAAYSVTGGVIRAAFHHADDVLAAGSELYLLEDSSKFKNQIQKAREQTGKAITNLSKKAEKEMYQDSLLKLQDMAVALLDEGKPQREANQAKINTRLAALRAELAKMESHPLTTGKVPSGIYRLQAVVDGIDVPLMDIEVSPP